MSGRGLSVDAVAGSWNPVTKVSPVDTEVPWYVIHSSCHHEGRVEERLRKKGLEVFLPRQTMVSRRQDRKKLLQVPLFPGYLFIHDSLQAPRYYDILNLPGVVRFLAFGDRLQAVPPETIASIKLALTANRPHLPHPYLQKGKRVRVLEGPLEGVIGVILKSRVRQRKLVIQVDLFRQAVAVELEDDAVEPWP
jgi:transcriptional antiterminator NusG